MTAPMWIIKMNESLYGYTMSIRDEEGGGCGYKRSDSPRSLS